MFNWPSLLELVQVWLGMTKLN